MWFQPQCYITEHSSVTLNHTMVQIIDITRTTRILNKRTLFSTLATFSKLRNIILSPWVSPSILHIFSRLNFFQLDFIFFKNIFYHFQPFSTFHSQKKTYHNTKSSLTASPHNPRLGILPFLSQFCVSIVLKELTFFLRKNCAVTFVMHLISYHPWRLWKNYILFLIFKLSHFTKFLPIILENNFTLLFNTVYRIHVEKYSPYLKYMNLQVKREIFKIFFLETKKIKSQIEKEV